MGDEEVPNTRNHKAPVGVVGCLFGHYFKLLFCNLEVCKMKSLSEIMGEWEKIKNEISSFPWGVENGNTADDAEYLTDADGNIINSCFDSFDKNVDRRFVLDAPKNYDLAMQALKEAVELVKEVRDCGAHRHNYAQDWLRKYGFEEGGKYGVE